MMRLLALDLSLTRTGWATAFGSGVLVPPATWNGPKRLAWIRDAVAQKAADTELVVLEGYSYASRGRATLSIAELGGVIRLALYDAGVRFVELPPAVLKKYATGRGNAPKAEVLVAAVRRLGYEGADDNEADALWLRTMALDAYGAIPAAVPKVQREALLRIRWPEVDGRLVAA